MIGLGYDSHRLEKGKRLIIGGVNIDSEFGSVAHSDGDTLLHALTDALLGAMGKGDIGEYYPDTDEKFKDADSSLFVRDMIILLKKENLNIVNIDITILLEKPKLMDYKPLIKSRVAELCEIPSSRVNIKAKTNEKIGFIGRSEGIAVLCICQLEKM